MLSTPTVTLPEQNACGWAAPLGGARLIRRGRPFCHLCQRTPGPCLWLRLAPGVLGATEQLGKQGADPRGHPASLVGLWSAEGAVCTLPRRWGGAVRGVGPCVPELEPPPPACPPGGRGWSVFPCTPDIGGSLLLGSPRPPQTRCVPPTPGPTGVWSRACVPEPGACPGGEPGEPSVGAEAEGPPSALCPAHTRLAPGDLTLSRWGSTRDQPGQPRQ